MKTIKQNFKNEKEAESVLRKSKKDFPASKGWTHRREGSMVISVNERVVGREKKSQQVSGFLGGIPMLGQQPKRRTNSFLWGNL